MADAKKDHAIRQTPWVPLAVMKASVVPSIALAYGIMQKQGCMLVGNTNSTQWRGRLGGFAQQKSHLDTFTINDDVDHPVESEHDDEENTQAVAEDCPTILVILSQYHCKESFGVLFVR